MTDEFLDLTHDELRVSWVRRKRTRATRRIESGVPVRVVDLGRLHSTIDVQNLFDPIRLTVPTRELLFDLTRIPLKERAA